jgi:hypothetical protein
MWGRGGFRDGEFLFRRAAVRKESEGRNSNAEKSACVAGELLRVTDPRSGARLCEAQHANTEKRRMIWTAPAERSGDGAWNGQAAVEME